MVICGGVNSILTPMKFIVLSKDKMISPTGLSHTFSDKADGYARGEGCGILVLKNLTKVIGLQSKYCIYCRSVNLKVFVPEVQKEINKLSLYLN